MFFFVILLIIGTFTDISLYEVLILTPLIFIIFSEEALRLYRFKFFRFNKPFNIEQTNNSEKKKTDISQKTEFAVARLKETLQTQLILCITLCLIIHIIVSAQYIFSSLDKNSWLRLYSTLLGPDNLFLNKIVTFIAFYDEPRPTKEGQDLYFKTYDKLWKITRNINFTLKHPNGEDSVGIILDKFPKEFVNGYGTYDTSPRIDDMDLFFVGGSVNTSTPIPSYWGGSIENNAAGGSIKKDAGAVDYNKVFHQTTCRTELKNFLPLLNGTFFIPEPEILEIPIEFTHVGINLAKYVYGALSLIARIFYFYEKDTNVTFSGQSDVKIISRILAYIYKDEKPLEFVMNFEKAYNSQFRTECDRANSEFVRERIRLYIQRVPTYVGFKEHTSTLEDNNVRHLSAWITKDNLNEIKMITQKLVHDLYNYGFFKEQHNYEYYEYLTTLNEAFYSDEQADDAEYGKDLLKNRYIHYLRDTDERIEAFLAVRITGKPPFNPFMWVLKKIHAVGHVVTWAFLNLRISFGPTPESYYEELNRKLEGRIIYVKSSDEIKPILRRLWDFIFDPVCVCEFRPEEEWHLTPKGEFVWYYMPLLIFDMYKDSLMNVWDISQSILEGEFVLGYTPRNPEEEWHLTPRGQFRWKYTPLLIFDISKDAFMNFGELLLGVCPEDDPTDPKYAFKTLESYFKMWRSFWEWLVCYQRYKGKILEMQFHDKQGEKLYNAVVNGEKQFISLKQLNTIKKAKNQIYVKSEHSGNAIDCDKADYYFTQKEIFKMPLTNILGISTDKNPVHTKSYMKTFGIFIVQNNPEVLSIFFVFLVLLLLPLCLVWVWEDTLINFEFIYISILILLFGLLGAFFTVDFFFFFFFFECVLIPIYLLIGIFGFRHRRLKAAYYLVFYTLCGSLFLFMAIAIISFEFGTTHIILLNNLFLDNKKQILLWILLFIGFAVKIPIFPLHIWLPEAHVEAPTVGSVILAAFLLKLGGFGLIKWVFFILPYGSFYLMPLFSIFSLLGVSFCALTALRQLDIKKMIAYSSISHMNLCILGIFSSTVQGLQGAVFLMLAHGLVSSALFFLVGSLYDRFHSKTLHYYGGLLVVMPTFSIFLFLFAIANFSFPGSPNFIAELLIILGLIKNNVLIFFFCSLGLWLSTCFSILLVNKLCFGPLKSFFKKAQDLSRREEFVLYTLTFFSILSGIWPFFFFNMSTVYFKNLIMLLLL